MIENYFHTFFSDRKNAFCLLNSENTILDLNNSFFKLLSNSSFKKEKFKGKEYFSTKIHSISDEENVKTALNKTTEWSKIIHLVGINNKINPYKIKTCNIKIDSKSYNLIEIEIQPKKQTEDAIEELEVEILQHLKTQSKLKQSEQITRNIFDSSLDIIFASDNKEKITEFSPSAYKVFEYEKYEINKIKIKHLFADFDQYKSIIKQLDDRGFFSGEVLHIKKNGEVFVSYISASRIINELGEKLGYMGISRDISEIKKAEIKIIESEKRYRELFINLSDAIIIVNENNDILEMNPEASNLFGLQLKKERVINLYDFIERKDIKKTRLKSKELRETGEIKGLEIDIIDAKARKKTVELSSNAVYVDGVFKGSRDILRDVTEKKIINDELRISLKQKEVLLKEVHHRVKNNLQVISSILNLQSSYVEDKKTLDILRESQNRVKSMSFIHENLYRTKDFNKIDFTEYIENLTKSMIHSYQYSENNISLILDLDNVLLSIDISIPCGLIINELLSNALKYAFPIKKTGTILISVKKQSNKRIQIIVEDNGVGYTKGLDSENEGSLGMLLVRTLIEQIDGKIELLKHSGTKYLITFDR
ncbi:MAG: histidine kinase dimerization/phosphoacceptor domain -containing protein [Flavobacteriales bacterium]|nr:histidine kinase dimerization/phosphoacceptor domain -containing protein [Flavobacteriales bacterium]